MNKAVKNKSSSGGELVKYFGSSSPDNSRKEIKENIFDERNYFFDAFVDGGISLHGECGGEKWRGQLHISHF